MILIKNIEVFAPQNLGVKDVLICGDRIEMIKENIQIDLDSVQIIDGSGKKLIPGLIDQHVHITGGGGEGGVTTRVPEIHIKEFIRNGITTVVGLLGTDGTTRSIEMLVAKAKSLNELGMTAFALTGSYEYPTVTLTGEIKRDMVYIQEIIGTKIALSDHRASHVSNHELLRVASNTKVGGMLSGKAGVLTIHMGDGKRGLKPIFECLEESDLHAISFRPTHLNRKDELLEESFELAKLGGFVDYTCGITGYRRPAEVVSVMATRGLPLDRVTVSSDGYGSYSSYDQDGKLIKIGCSPVDSLMGELKCLVKEKAWTLDQALPFFTANVAKAIGQSEAKGKIEAGFDADLLLINDAFEIDTYIAKGDVLLSQEAYTKKFPYED